LLETHIRLLDRQGLFKGDLNISQRTSLLWLMGKEIEEESELEKARALNFALAANPNTSGEFIKILMEQEEKPEYIYEDEPDWQTPENIEEVQKLIRDFESQPIP
jgi:hypothetical protein